MPLTWMCDDNPDCSDASDEKSCSKAFCIARFIVVFLFLSTLTRLTSTMNRPLTGFAFNCDYFSLSL